MTRRTWLRRHGLDKIRAGGRWHRLLRALRSEPLTTADLFRATDPGTHEPRTERHKVKTAARDLSTLGLVAQHRPWGWLLTPDGQATLMRLEAETPTAPADGEISSGAPQ